jgi:4-diphosphocytidyl-2-C-methyl-D-erythritol kinase
MTTVKEKAYAKINLFLDVVAKREDGFHEIKTVMHTVSLCDDVTVSVQNAHNNFIRISIPNCAYIPTDNRNLAYRAAELFLDRLGKKATVNIHLYKRIPVAAGLAGGSTDAAAVLRAMNKAWRKPFSNTVLAKMAAELGSDVPYCVMGGTALCEGRGELMTPISTSLHLYTVIAIARERMSTPEAYSTLDNIYSDFTGALATGGDACYPKMFSALSENTGIDDGLFNVFECAVLPKCEGARNIKKRMAELGATSVLMSGSGPSVYGIFPDLNSAKAAENVLRSENYSAWFAETV